MHRGQPPAAARRCPANPALVQHCTVCTALRCPLLRRQHASRQPVRSGAGQPAGTGSSTHRGQPPSPVALSLRTGSCHKSCEPRRLQTAFEPRAREAVSPFGRALRGTAQCRSAVSHSWRARRSLRLAPAPDDFRCSNNQRLASFRRWNLFPEILISRSFIYFCRSFCGK